jgi:hypothetical protein
MTKLKRTLVAAAAVLGLGLAALPAAQAHDRVGVYLSFGPAFAWGPPVYRVYERPYYYAPRYDYRGGYGYGRERGYWERRRHDFEHGRGDRGRWDGGRDGGRNGGWNRGGDGRYDGYRH